MRTQNFGIEVEMTGITRNAAAKILAKHFGTSAVHVGGSYDAYTVDDGMICTRKWIHRHCFVKVRQEHISVGIC